MEFRIADTFTDSLGRLTCDEQKAVKTTAFDLQLNPANPGMQFHKLERGRDKRFWSVRVNLDLRLIVHRSEASLLLCYVDHHDRAYAWAQRRKLEVHPTTGAMQLVEVRETARQVVVPVFVPPAATDAAAKARRMFEGVADEELLGFGVPAEWLPDVKDATEETLLTLADHLPAEAAEALLELATGGKPRRPRPAATEEAGFAHPDAQRRFRIITGVEELQAALDQPWDKWTIFLHPDQRQWVERDYNGPARVGGSAGTGKTIVALHRAAHIARAHPEARVLLTTFSEALANALRARLRRLLAHQPRLGERIDVHALPSFGERLHRSLVGPVKLAQRRVVVDLMRAASAAVGGHRFSLAFLLAEWEHVVDAWQIETWESYRDVARLGRKTRLPEAQRKVLWSIFARVRDGLRSAAVATEAEVFTAAAAALAGGRHQPFDFAVIDEAQDLGVPHLRFLAALAGDRPNGLFFAGDLGQRIFQQPFSWRTLGVDIRGRSRTLRVNYRTSHQIRMQADRLLGPVVTDADGNAEDRRGTVSVFNGPVPTIRAFPDEAVESAAVGEWVARCLRTGVAPHEIGVFVRSEAQLARARDALQAAGAAFQALDDQVDTPSGRVAIGTMLLAKGLEFRAVAVMACDDDVIPLQQRIEAVGDEGDLAEVYETERHLLYVACTRARDQLLVTSVEPGSEFVQDMCADASGSTGHV